MMDSRGGLQNTAAAAAATAGSECHELYTGTTTTRHATTATTVVRNGPVYVIAAHGTRGVHKRKAGTGRGGWKR